MTNPDPVHAAFIGHSNPSQTTIRTVGSKLLQESHVVFIKLADVGDAVAAHAKAFDPQTESKSAELFRIVAHGRKHVRINHSGPAELDPAIVPLHVGFDRGFGEREERRPEANVNVLAEVARGKHAEDAL